MLHTYRCTKNHNAQSRICKFLVVNWKVVTVGVSIVFQITKKYCETANFLITTWILVLLKFGLVKQLTGWTCGINYGQKITNVVELKYRQHFSGPWKPDRTSESKNWCGNWNGCNQSDRRWRTPFGFSSRNPNSEYENYEFKKRNERAAVKRRITNTLKK